MNRHAGRLTAGLAGCLAIVLAGCGAAGTSSQTTPRPATNGVENQTTRPATNGLESQTAAQVARAANTALKAAASVHVRGTFYTAHRTENFNLRYEGGSASGKFTVNGRPAKEYFPNHAWEHDATEPLKFTSLTEQVDVVATAKGGGVGGQSGAVRMGLSRAISRFNPELRPALRKNGFLTRDSRMKERKKYGQKGARKRFQFTKR